MSKARELSTIEKEKRANVINDITPKFFGELAELCKREQVSVIPAIKPVGEPKIEVMSLRPNPKRTIWNRLHIKKYTATETERHKVIIKRINDILDKHKIIFFAVITQVGAQIQIDLRADYDLSASALWTPPDIGKVSPATIMVKK